ncbi:hypothetical protein KI387_018505, partial [Taxus chinensis]
GLINWPVYITRHWLQALRISLGQFKVGSHRLRVEDHQLDRSERIYQLCSLQEIETQDHFIFRCPIYYEIIGRFHCLFCEHLSFAAFFKNREQQCLALYLQETFRLRNETLQSPPRQTVTLQITSFFTVLSSMRGTKRHLDTSQDSRSRSVRTHGATSQAIGTRARTQLGVLTQRLRPFRRTHRA